MSPRSGPAHTGVSKDAAIRRETVFTNSGKSSTPFGWQDSSLMNASTSWQRKIVVERRQELHCTKSVSVGSEAACALLHPDQVINI